MVGWSGGASCRMASEAMMSPGASDCGRSVLRPAVSSQSRDQALRSRPDPASMSDRKSARVALPYCRCLM